MIDIDAHTADSLLCQNTGRFIPSLKNLGVLDHQLLIAGLTGKYTLVMSREIMEETQAIVERKFKDSGQTDEAVLFLGDMVLASEYHHGLYQKGIMDSATALIRDKKDIIHAAFIMTVGPDIFVTGDKDFLEHPKIGSTLVMTTKEALKLLEE